MQLRGGQAGVGAGGQLTQLVFALYTRTHACMHTLERAHTHACAHTYTHARAHKHTQIHACAHARTHALSRTHAHAHMTGTFRKEKRLTDDCFENGYKLKQAGTMARAAGQARSAIQYLPNGGFDGTDGEGLHAEGWCVPRL